MVPNPEKHPDLLGAIKKAVETGQYLDTTHVTQRKSQRQVLRTEIEYVLCHGHHAAKKDKFDEMNQAWNYAIEGSTLDKRKLRVIGKIPSLS